MAVDLPKTDVVIVGLGAVGGVAALPLTRAGRDVIGLEAGAWMRRRDFAPDEPSVAEFEFGPDGIAVALTFTSGSFSDFGRRVRVGNLPEEWQ